MYAMSRTARLRRSVGRFLGVLALTGTALFAATTVAAPPAYADAANCTNGFVLCTTIQYGGQWTPTPLDPGGPGGSNSSSPGYVSSCWLQPNTAWQNQNQDASSPAGFKQYFDDMTAAAGKNQDELKQIATALRIYQDATSGDVGVKPAYPPFNIGHSGGSWYTIACDSDTYKYQDYAAIQAAMGVSAAYVQWEAWFWIADGEKRLRADRHAATALAIFSIRDREQRLHFRTTIKAARLQADGLRGRDRGGGAGVKGGETREAYRVERSSTAGGGEAAEHVVAADQMSNSVVPN